MNSLITYLIHEGLLTAGSSEAQMKAFDDSTAEEWLGKYGRGKYEIKPKKEGVAIKGNIIIKGNPSANIPIKLAAFDGVLALEGCTNMTPEGLSEIFAPGFKGDKMDLIITDCPKIDSLDWIPDTLRGLSVSGCKALRTLPSGKKVTGQVTLTQNGKRWKKEQAERAFGAPQNIYCSAEEMDRQEIINEAFRVAQLSALVDQLKREGNPRPIISQETTIFNISNAELDREGKDIHFYLYSKYSSTRKKGVLGDYKLRFDRISPSNVRTVMNPTERDLKSLRIWSMLRYEWMGGGFLNGIIMCADDKGYQIVTTLINGSGLCWVNKGYHNMSEDVQYDIVSGTSARSRGRYNSVTPSWVMNKIKKVSWKEITVIYLDEAAMDEDELDAHSLVDQRSQARNGVILSHDLSALNRLIDKNRMRLKENARKLRESRDNRLKEANNKINSYIEFSQQTNQKIITILDLLSSGRKIVEYDQKVALRSLVEELYDFNGHLFGRKDIDKYYSNFRPRPNPKITENTGVVTLLSRAISQKYSQVTHFDFEKQSGRESGEAFSETIKDIEWSLKGLDSIKQRIERLLQKLQNLKIM